MCTLQLLISCNTIDKGTGNTTYIEAFSGGVAKDGWGYFSSNTCVITSESATHLSSSFTIGTLPSGLIVNNLMKCQKKDDGNGTINKGNSH